MEIFFGAGPQAIVSSGTKKGKAAVQPLTFYSTDQDVGYNKRAESCWYVEDGGGGDDRHLLFTDRE